VVLACGCGRLQFATHDPPAEPLPQGCPPAAIFCDDFASGDLSAWPQSDVTAGASLAVAAGGGHAGGNALDAMVPAIRSGSIAAVVATFDPHSTGTLASREWVLAPQPLAPCDSVITVWSDGPR